MSDYIKGTNFSTLADSDADPAIFDTEFTAVANASATKVDNTGDTLTGALVVPAGASGTQVVRANEIYNYAFPVGTKMAFFQAAAPTGWTQDIANNDAMLRVVSGAGGGIGGTDSPLTGLSTTDPHTLTIAEMPSHAHSYGTISYNSLGGAVAQGNRSPQTTSTTAASGGNGGHTHGITFTPKYIDMIIATKD